MHNLLVATMTANISNSINNRIGRVDNYASQSRTYGPLLGLLLANLIGRVVSAKYSPFLGFPPFPNTYDPNPWLAYNKPLPVYQVNPPVPYPQWYPIKNPYPPIFQTYPQLTPEPPHHQVELPHHENYDDHYEDGQAQESQIVTTVESPVSKEPEAQEASNSRRRVPYYRKRTTSRRRSPSKRRRTTPEPEYYDSYEDYPSRRRPAYADSYEDDYDYDFRPRRKTTQRNKFRRRTTTSAYDYDIDDEDAKTEIIIVRQRQATTTPSTVITSGSTSGTTTTGTGGTTTTETPGNTTINNNNSTGGYYGPSNGNEGISITYGPPYYYPAPYNDWYTHEARNTVVQKVHEIVGAPDYNYERKLRI